MLRTIPRSARIGGPAQPLPNKPIELPGDAAIGSDVMQRMHDFVNRDNHDKPQGRSVHQRMHDFVSDAPHDEPDLSELFIDEEETETPEIDYAAEMLDLLPDEDDSFTAAMG